MGKFQLQKHVSVRLARWLCQTSIFLVKEFPFQSEKSLSEGLSTLNTFQVPNLHLSVPASHLSFITTKQHISRLSLASLSNDFIFFLPLPLFIATRFCVGFSRASRSAMYRPRTFNFHIIVLSPSSCLPHVSTRQSDFKCCKVLLACCVVTRELNSQSRFSFSAMLCCVHCWHSSSQLSEKSGKWNWGETMMMLGPNWSVEFV